ncbi:hypothetical protein ACFQ1S_43915, partial [Kibdelosporangium lantanae]
IGLDPLSPGNIGYLLWMILGYLLVSAVLVVALGRLGDMFGRYGRADPAAVTTCMDPSQANAVDGTRTRVMAARVVTERNRMGAGCTIRDGPARRNQDV